MNIDLVCKIIEEARGKSVLVATMGAMNSFDRLGADQPRINSVPLMGGAAGIGLGIAIGSPSQNVIVVDGDASLLMQLGVLATVADQQPANFVHVVIHNGSQFSGFSNLAIPAQSFVDFAGMAAAAGYRETFTYDDLDQFAAEVEAMLKSVGPVFVELRVDPPAPRPGISVEIELSDQQFRRMGDEARALSRWLEENASD